MINVFGAEWARLSRRRPTAIAVGATSALAVCLTWVVLATATDEMSGGGFSIPMLEARDGLVVPAVTAASFLFMVLLAGFIAMSAGGYSRGTTRAALLRQPRRLTLAAGEFLARWVYVVLLLTAGLAVSLVTAVLAGPVLGVSTSAWASWSSVGAVTETVGRLGVFAFGWGLVGTVLGVLTRSTPVALGIGLLWAGPFENILGDQVDAGPRYFPGLLLREALSPEVVAVPDGRVALTLGAYGLLVVAVLLVILRRRDVTA